MENAAVQGGGVVDAIARTWRDPRGAMAARVAAGLSESRALADLMLACALFFVASLPGARREAAMIASQTADPFVAAVAAHAFAWIAVAPLAAYGIAAGVHLIARAFGARPGFLPARVALFAAMLAGAPLALGLSLLGTVLEGTPVVGLLACAATAAWLWMFSGLLAEAEGFRMRARVAAVAVVLVAGVVGAAALLTGAGA